MLVRMSDVTRLLDAAAAGEPHAAAELLPLVYAELRKLAAARLAAEAPGHTLQPTALVHEAYLRLVGGSQPQDWNGRGHFFGAAAEAMRRILVEAARHKQSQKAGGGRRRVELGDVEPVVQGPDIELIALDEALAHFALLSERRAQVVELRFFGGMSVEETAEALSVSPETVKRDWKLAKAWLLRELRANKAS